MKENILIVDDDTGICEILEFNLKSEGYTVAIAHSAEEALPKITAQTHLILLDVMMQGMSGFKMLEILRSEGRSVPVILLTAKDTENDMLTGFSVGADDYISKPFSIKEVLARVKAVLLRAQRINEPKEQRILVFGELKLDLENGELSIGNEAVKITKTEFKILKRLVESPGRVFSRQEIMESVWGEDVFVSERTVDVHIARLRKKMKTYGARLTNRLGFGYKFEV